MKVFKEKHDLETVVNNISMSLEKQPRPNDTCEKIDFTVSKTISSNMVVQRNNYFNVFGWSNNYGGVIYADFMGETRYGIINDNGEWSIKFSPHEATFESQTLKIYPSNGNAIEFEDILIGDVWLVSGQSNAELNMSVCIPRDLEYKNEINKEEKIRIFSQTREYVVEQKNVIDLSVPQRDVINDEWKWNKASFSAVSSFSALGYYFANELSKMANIPLGVIMTAAGGATIHELMPNNVSLECKPNFVPTVPAGGFYNSLMYPFVKNPITGMIFYQGESESNAGHYKTYANNLIKTFNGYRKEWGLNFPIINVQLSTHGEEGFKAWYEIQNIRAIQFDVTKKLDNCYLIVSRDHGIRPGDDDFGHPKYKHQLGVRAANVAAKHIYSIDIDDALLSPEPCKVTWNIDNAIIDFCNVGEGLKLLDGQCLAGFTVLDADGNNIICEAEIIDECSVKITFSGHAAKLQFAMLPNAIIRYGNLGNSLGLPAPCFEIDK